MTQNLEGERFRVIDSDSITPVTLATQIYETYMEPDAVAPDRSLSKTLDEIAPAESDNGAASNEEEITPSQPHQLNLPSQPPLAQRKPGTTQNERVPRRDPLTEKESTRLMETLQGKLDATELQALLALLQKQPEPATQEQSPRSHPLPLSARTVNRYRLGSIVLILILLGVLSSVVLNRPTGKGLVLPNAPTDTTNPTLSPTATPSVQATAIPQLDATLASRNVALETALKESEGQRDALDRTRRDYLLSLADAEVKKNGTPVEVWLIRRLNAQILELRRALGKGGQFSGDAKQISTARALVGDARAILLALQQEWQTPNAAPGRNRTAPAVLTQQMNELAELARIVREASYEQQLRDQERSQASDQGEASGSAKPKEGKKNGILPSP